MFAAKDGIALANLEGVRIISTEFVTPGDWENYYPSAIHADYLDGKYFGFYLYGTVKGGFILDLVNNIWMRLNFHAQAGYVATETGKYYLVVDDDSTTDPKPQCIKEWDGDPYNYLYYRWKSRKYLFSSDLNFSVARITIDQEFYNAVLALISANDYLLDQNEDLFNESIAQINGDLDAFTGEAGDTINVTIDGTLYEDIDIAACTTITLVAAAINTAAEGSPASVDDDGYLQIVGCSGVTIADGTSTGQTVIDELFSVEGDRTDTAVPLGGSIGESSLTEYGILCDEIIGVENVSISGSITFRLYADGVLKFSKTVSNGEMFRLPAGFKARDYEYQIEGYIPVRSVYLATSAIEMMNG
jgi:hypothetical protein